MLLGWFGCQDRYLAKYSELLKGLGYSSVRAICPPWRVFSPTHHPRRAWAAQLLRNLEAVDAAHGAQRRWVVYAFSNGGGFPVEQVDWLLAHAPEFKHLRGRVAGVAYDSSPCYMHPTVGARALGEGKPLPVRVLTTAVFWLIAAAMLFLAPNRPAVFW